MEIKERFLPIGTVCLLKGGNKKVMIISYLIFSTGNDKKAMYDYGACQFPEGVLDSKTGIGFNHSDIEKVLYMGYSEDEEFQKFNETVNAYADEIKEGFKNSLKAQPEKE